MWPFDAGCWTYGGGMTGLRRRGLRVFVTLVSVLAIVGCRETVVKITSPVHGDFVQTGSVNVSGTVNVKDAAVVVNGVVAVVDQETLTWSATVPLDPDEIFNPLEAIVLREGVSEATARVVVLVGDSIDRIAHAADSVGVRINDSGIDKLQDLLTGLVDLDIGTLIPPGVELVNECWYRDPLFGTCLWRAVISTTEAGNSSDASVDIDAQVGGSLDAVVQVHDLALNVRIEGVDLDPLNIFPDIPLCEMSLVSGGFALAGLYEIEPLVDRLGVDVSQVQSLLGSLPGFDQLVTGGVCDVPIIGDIVQFFLPDLEDLADGALEDFLNNLDGLGNTPVARALEHVFRGLETSGAIGELAGLGLDSPFSAIIEDATGVTFSADTLFESLCPDAGPDLTASFAFLQPLPEIGNVIPGGDVPFDVGMLISNDAINQLLATATACGFGSVNVAELDLDGVPGLDAVTSDLLSQLDSGFADVGEGVPLQVRLRQTLAPVLSGHDGAGALLDLNIAQLVVEIVEIDGVVERKHLVLAVDGILGLGLDFVEDALACNLAVPPDLSGINWIALRNPHGVDVANLSSVVRPLLQALVPQLGGVIDGYPLPKIPDLNLSAIEVSRIGEYISIFADHLE